MQGSNPKSLKGLKIGWEQAKLRKDPMNEKICVICGKPFSRRGKKKFTAKCCSRECCNKYKKGKSFWKKENSVKVLIKCLCGKEFLTFPSAVKKGNKYCSWECSKRFNRGENFWKWKGGTKSERDRQYHSEEYQNWRIGVFTRDGFKCVECGKIGGELNAHHIKARSLYPELVFDVNNGITLCLECHKKTES
jgi:5-methylcytosine-specific restriction endonuclease McrA